MPAVLDDFVVLDLTSYLAGPYGCALLGDVGARIIKVEAPGGDMMRRYPSTLDGENRAFLGANRNKQSIQIDLKSSQGRDLLHRMVDKSDVLVHNFRPGVATSLSIDYESLKSLRQDLIYCSLTGYGESPDGPLRRHPGYDQMLQSFTGIAAAQGEPAGHPEILSGSIVDLFCSSVLAFGVMSAIVHQLRTGKGQHVEVSLLRSALALQVGRFVWSAGEERDIRREPTGGRVSGIFSTKDGYLYLQASTPRFWRSLCEILDLPELAEDPRYDTLKKRYDESGVIMPKIERALLTRTAREWESLMIDRVPGVAVRSIGEMFDDPQVAAEGLAVEYEHPVVGRYRAMGAAVKMGSGQAFPVRAPMLGEHADGILRSFGLDAAEIASLRSSGVVL